MKILLATDAFYPMISGVVTSTVTLFRELEKMGHDVRILTLSDDNQEKFENNIYSLKSIKINIYPDARIKFMSSSNIISLITEWSPDIIHTQTEFTVMIVARKISNKLHIPIIHTYHTMYEDYTNFLIRSKKINTEFVSQVIKQMLNKFSGVITPSSKTTKALLRYKVKTPIYTIPTGLDLKKFSQKVDDRELNALKEKYDLVGRKTLVYLGRISKEKNIDELIRFISSNKTYFGDKRFIIAGGGPFIEKLKELVNNLDMNNIIKFTGMVFPGEVYKYYKLGNIFVTASTTETQGLTYIEAMASNIPVVCRQDECVEELIQNSKNGFKYSSEESFMSSIKSIFSNDELYENMCKECSNSANEYSSETFAEKIIRAYEISIADYNYSKEQDLEFNNLVNEMLGLSNVKKDIEGTLETSKDKVFISVSKLKDGTLEIEQYIKNKFITIKKGIRINKK
jgi:1,2-diacylglycerol 3-alpha-glucosyltransferase